MQPAGTENMATFEKRTQPFLNVWIHRTGSDLTGGEPGSRLMEVMNRFSGGTLFPERRPGIAKALQRIRSAISNGDQMDLTNAIMDLVDAGANPGEVMVGVHPARQAFMGSKKAPIDDENFHLIAARSGAIPLFQWIGEQENFMGNVWRGNHAQTQINLITGCRGIDAGTLNRRMGILDPKTGNPEDVSVIPQSLMLAFIELNLGILTSWTIDETETDKIATRLNLPSVDLRTRDGRSFPELFFDMFRLQIRRDSPSTSLLLGTSARAVQILLAAYPQENLIFDEHGKRTPLDALGELLNDLEWTRKINTHEKQARDNVKNAYLEMLAMRMKNDVKYQTAGNSTANTRNLNGLTPPNMQDHAGSSGKIRNR